MSCCCTDCYRLTPASTGVEAIYKTSIEDGVRKWYDENGQLITDATLIAELDAAAEEANKVDCHLYVEQLVEDTDFETEVFCEFDTTANPPTKTGIKVAVVVAIDESGQPTSNQFDLATGAPYTAPADTSLMLCEEDNDIDLEPKEMCDNEATTFLRWFQSTNGVPTGTSFDTDLDGVPYVPTGPVSLGICGEETCYLTDVYKVTSAGAGVVNVQSWYDPATNATGNAVTPYSPPATAFSGPEDINCLPSHINGAPDATYTINDFDFTDSADAPTGWIGEGTDQHLIYSWVSVPFPITLVENGPNAEAGIVWLGECGGKPRIVGDWEDLTSPFTGGGILTNIPAGFHFLAVQMSDPSAFSRIRLSYSTDGGVTTQPLPVEWLHAGEPTIECLKAEVCPKSGDVTLLDGTAITVDNVEYFYCPPSCEAVTVEPSTRFEVSEACFRDPSAASNVTVYGYKKIEIDKTSGEIVSVTYLDADGTTELDQSVFIQTKCC